MSLAELFPTVKMLPHDDKFRLMQFLVMDLAQEEGVPLLIADLEQQHAQGYARHPLKPDEFDQWESEQMWGEP